jgi:tRNA threonylcarbamoyl adenosine modification protein (Sua5/YciO/YrdC/YwlC family)
MADLLRSSDPEVFKQAADLVTKGGLICFPTDTVYGVGCDAYQDRAIDKLYKAKRRPRDLPLPVLIGSASHVEGLVHNLPDTFWPIVSALWPGPLTLVVGMSNTLPDSLSLEGTVGLRMPNLPFALDLLEATGPMAVTSANRSGSKETRTAKEVFDQLGDTVDLIIDGGRTPGTVASTVLDLTTHPPQILREGPVSRDQLEQFIHF